MNHGSILSGTTGGRVVSVPDSGSEEHGFDSQSRRCRVAVLGKLFTPIVPRLTQPCIPSGSLNRVPASAGVKVGKSPLPGGRQHCVIPYGMWFPVAVWWSFTNCYTLPLPFFLQPCFIYIQPCTMVNEALFDYHICTMVSLYRLSVTRLDSASERNRIRFRVNTLGAQGTLC